MALAAVLKSRSTEPGRKKLIAYSPSTLSGTVEVEPGWLLCNGALVSTTTYANLFAAVGHLYNGGVDPGGGQFRLPNHLDKIAAHKGSTKGTVGVSAGQLGHTHTLNSHNHGLPSHQHDMQGHVHSMQGHGHFNAGSGGPNQGGVSAVTGSFSSDATIGHGHTATSVSGPNIGNTGGESSIMGGPSTGVTGSASPVSAPADPPYLVVGGMAIKY